ncbi:MAG: acyltransferase [Bacteroidales bacterium]|nr:acyltransferase [Bacteroidales bacterium]
MLKKLTIQIIRKLGRADYTLDPAIRSIDLITILRLKLGQALRGFWIKMFLAESSGLLFIGRRCKILYKSHISVGKTVTLGDHVEINALSKEGIKIGNNVSINNNSIIECTGVIRNLGEGLVIGNNVGIAQNCFIQVRGKVRIGNDVIMGPGVSIFSENHNYTETDAPIHTQGETRIGVVIEDGCWLGTKAVILDGVTLGHDSIVAANAVVNKSFPPYSIVAGVPAKLIKNRKSEE